MIRNGVEVPAATTDGEAQAAELLFVGRLVPEKGVEELVEASGGPDLVVVGEFGPLRAGVATGTRLPLGS